MVRVNEKKEIRNVWFSCFFVTLPCLDKVIMHVSYFLNYES